MKKLIMITAFIALTACNSTKKPTEGSAVNLPGATQYCVENPQDEYCIE